MTSRKLMVYLDGLLIDGRSADGWYAKSVRRDYAEIEAVRQAEAERLARAQNKAQITRQPLKMSEL